jgi:hypothetical protein
MPPPPPPLTSPQGPHCQRDGSNLYMTLHVHKVDDRTVVKDGDTPVNVPAGWEIAPGDAHDIRVCGAHPWQSYNLVFSNGDSYGTAMQADSGYVGATLFNSLRARVCSHNARGHMCAYIYKICQTLSPSKNLIFSRLKVGKKVGSGYLIQDEQGARAYGDASEVLRRRRA